MVKIISRESSDESRRGLFEKYREARHELRQSQIEQANSYISNAATAQQQMMPNMGLAQGVVGSSAFTPMRSTGNH